MQMGLLGWVANHQSSFRKPPLGCLVACLESKARIHWATNHPLARLQKKHGGWSFLGAWIGLALVVVFFGSLDWLSFGGCSPQLPSQPCSTLWIHLWQALHLPQLQQPTFAPPPVAHISSGAPPICKLRRQAPAAEAPCVAGPGGVPDSKSGVLQAVSRTYSPCSIVPPLSGEEVPSLVQHHLCQLLALVLYS